MRGSGRGSWEVGEGQGQWDAQGQGERLMGSRRG